MSDQQVTMLDEDVPSDFSVSVLMERSLSKNRWLDERWEAVGITVRQWQETPSTPSVTLVHEQGEVQQYLHAGFRLQLHADECESYYHNLCSPSPNCFVMASEEGDGVPKPFRVSLSFDEAHAYMEGEEQVYAVSMPPELYRWCELFVLNHYVPEMKKKRKRRDWRQGGQLQEGERE